MGYLPLGLSRHRSAGFPACCIADFPVGRRSISAPAYAGWKTCATVRREDVLSRAIKAPVQALPAFCRVVRGY